MAHEFESGMFVREKAWHGLGTIVQEAPTSADALRLAGLDWNVIQKPVFTDGNEIKHYMANVRDRDNSVLGIVSDRYKIVQNQEAFDFTDALIGDDVRYESCGSLKNGRTVWLLAKMPNTTILKDKVEPYMCFTNSHDGTGAIKVCMTPVRVVCNNTLNFALATAKRSWSTKHMGDMSTKLYEAQHTLQLANDYMKQLNVRADQLANTTITDERIHEIVEELFPLEKDASDCVKNRTEKMRDGFIACCFAPDLIEYFHTAWGVVNASADFGGHIIPNRNTDTYRENNFGRIIDGHPIVDKVYDLVCASV